MTSAVTPSELDDEPAISQREPLTLAHLLHTAVVALAALLRLSQLGRAPLTPAEAHEALAVWGAWQSASIVPEPFFAYSPAYFSLTSFLTLFAGFSDATMRLMPALAGIALIALPFFLRRELGAIGALVAALGLALSPTLTAVSRTAGGESFALLATAILTVSWVRYQAEGQEKWLLVACAAVAAGLTTAPLFYSFAVALAVTWGLHLFMGPHLFDENRQPERETLIRGGITAVVTFVLLGLALLTYPNGLGGTLNILGRWLGAFGLPGDLESWLNPILALVRYDTAVVLVGLTGALWATWRHQPWGSLLAYGLMIGLILMLIQPGELSNVLVTALFGYLLVGVVVQAIFPRNRLSEEGVWPLAGLFLVLGLIIAHALGRYARSFPPQNNSYLILIVMAVVIWVVILGMVVAWERRLAWQALFFALLALTAVSSWGTAWRLGHTAVNDPRERWVVAGTADNAQQLAPFMADLSEHYRGAARTATVFSMIDQTSLRWYLRDFPQVTYGHTLPAGAVFDMILTRDTAVESSFVADYTGTSFQLTHSLATPHTLTLADSLRWWFFYQSPVPLDTDELILWLRADLLQ